jgi:hypothetical protein
MRSSVKHQFPLAILVVVVAGIATGAQKPSPFTPRKSEPAVQPAAPVSPVSPVRVGHPPLPVAGVAAVQVVPAAASHASGAAAAVVVVPAVVAPVNRVTTAVPRAEPDIVDVTPGPPPIEVVEAKPVPVRDVAIGLSRDEVVLKVGRPATSVSMYNDANYVESMRYEWRGRWIGTVRLTNGKVTKVETP